MSEQLDYVQVNAELAVSHLQAQDRAAVLTFADKTSVRVPFTSDTDTLLRAITQGVDSNNKWDGGNIDGAVERAAEFVRKSARPDARRIALFITGNMHYREMDGRKLQRAVSASGAIFSAVLTTREFRAKALFEANPQLHADIMPFVKATGGDLLDGERPGPASQVLLDKYRARYLLDVDSDGVNQIIVSLSDLARGVYPGAEVRSSLLKHP
jgi:hypothetical protein